MPDATIANPTDNVKIDATNTLEAFDSTHEDNNNDTNIEVNTDEAAEKDVDPAQKPSPKDAKEDHEEDDEIEYDECKPPICKVHKGANKVMVVSEPIVSPTAAAESESDQDYFPCIDDGMDHSDFIHTENVPSVKCHNEQEGRIPIIELGEFSII